MNWNKVYSIAAGAGFVSAAFNGYNAFETYGEMQRLQGTADTYEVSNPAYAQKLDQEAENLEDDLVISLGLAVSGLGTIALFSGLASTEENTRKSSLSNATIER